MVVGVTIRGPEWFFGIDSLFEGFAVIALLLITLFSFSAYNFTKDKRYRTFAIGFGLMTLGLIARALTDLAVFMDFKAHILALMGGYAAYMGLTLLSLIVLFALTFRSKERAPYIAMILIAIIGVLLSASYRLSFHAMSIILLAFITMHFVRNYRAKKSFTALLVASSFGLLTITNIAFIIDIVRHKFYIIGHLIHLAAFILLFIALVRVKMGKKK